MGKLKQGILGGFSGKVANIVGSSWKGIAIIKAMPLSVANPKTAAQVAQRGKFSYLVSLAKLMLTSIIKPYWDRFAQYMSGYNDFMKANIHSCDSTSITDPAAFDISQGKMASTVLASYAVAAGTKQLDITWDDDSGSGYKLADDTIAVVVYNTTQKQLQVSFDPAALIARSALSLSYVLGIDLAENDIVYIYTAFRRSDGTIVSATKHTPVTVSA